MNKDDLVKNLTLTIDRAAYMARLTTFDDVKLKEAAEHAIELLGVLATTAEDQVHLIESRVLEAIKEIEDVDPKYYQRIIQKEQAGTLQPLGE